MGSPTVICCMTHGPDTLQSCHGSVPRPHTRAQPPSKCIWSSSLVPCKAQVCYMPAITFPSTADGCKVWDRQISKHHVDTWHMACSPKTLWCPGVHIPSSLEVLQHVMVSCRTLGRTVPQPGAPHQLPAGPSACRRMHAPGPGSFPPRTSPSWPSGPSTASMSTGAISHTASCCRLTAPPSSLQAAGRGGACLGVPAAWAVSRLARVSAALSTQTLAQEHV